MSTTATKTQPGRTRTSSAGKGSKSGASKTKAKRASAKSKAKGTAAKSKRASSAKAKTASPKPANKDGGKRLKPGGLDKLVLDWMKKNPANLPATAGTIGRGIKRSSGAVSNCLERQEKAGTVKLKSKKPRQYDLVVSSS